ncbi:MAG: protein kinase [Acidobacteriia bacterium]|nr:protein kinase [Terriglobia bacterium]
MSPGIRRDVETAFAAALELAESEQAAFLAREYGHDPDLRAEVESLLRAHHAAADFLEPAAARAPRIGPYRIVDHVGAGGMGSVFRAERDDGQFRQQVAIKMISAGLDTRQEIVRRFLHERQILADLAHPSIARLLDGGYTDTGAQGNPNRQNLGDLAAALESYGKAERLARKLIAGQSSDEAKRLMVDALTAQAYGSLAANQKAKGASKAMEALQVARERARSGSQNENAQLQLGTALQCAAVFATDEDALSYIREEASVFEEMLAPNRMRNAALAHKYIGGALNTKGDADGAFAHLKRAEELDAACVREAPNDPEHKMDLAIDLSQWGEYYERKNDIPKAIEYTQTALVLRRELVAADPKEMRAQERLAYILRRLGDLQLNVSARQALASYEEARSVGERLQTQSLRTVALATSLSGIGAAYRKIGDSRRYCSAYAESTKLYPEVIKQSPWYAEFAAEAEKAYALCSGASH